MSFQPGAFQDDAFQFEDVPATPPNLGGGWAVKFDTHGTRRRRRKELEDIEAAINLAWQALNPVEVEAQPAIEIPLPEIPRIDWAAVEAERDEYRKTKQSLELALSKLNKLIEARRRDEEEVEMLLLLS